MADVESGLHISGGADSAILGNISKYFNKSLSAYTFDFEIQNIGESKQAKLIAEKFELKHHVHKVKILIYSKNSKSIVSGI